MKTVCMVRPRYEANQEDDQLELVTATDIIKQLRIYNPRMTLHQFFVDDVGDYAHINDPMTRARMLDALPETLEDAVMMTVHKSAHSFGEIARELIPSLTLQKVDMEGDSFLDDPGKFSPIEDHFITDQSLIVVAPIHLLGEIFRFLILPVMNNPHWYNLSMSGSFQVFGGRFFHDYYEVFREYSSEKHPKTLEDIELPKGYLIH